MDVKLSTIRQIAITVADVATALPYYRDILGLEHLFSPSGNLAFLSAGPVRLMLSIPQADGKGAAQAGASVGANSTLYFAVTQIETSYAALVARGAIAERAPHSIAKMPDHDLWLAFLRDPDGNLIGLLEEKR